MKYLEYNIMEELKNEAEKQDETANENKKENSGLGYKSLLAATYGAAIAGGFLVNELGKESTTLSESQSRDLIKASDKAQKERHSPEKIESERLYKVGLHQYFKSVNAYPDLSNDFGDFEKYNSEFVARAIEIVQRKGVTIAFCKGSPLDIIGISEHLDIDLACGLVPIKIVVNGQIIPLSRADYTEAELGIVDQFMKMGGATGPQTTYKNYSEWPKEKH